MGVFAASEQKTVQLLSPFWHSFCFGQWLGVSGSAWRNLEKVIRALTALQTPPVVGNVARGGSCPHLSSQYWTQAFSWERCSAITLVEKTLSTVVADKAQICLPESLFCFIAQLAILVFGIQTAAQMIQRSYYVEYTVYDCLQCLKDIF